MEFYGHESHQSLDDTHAWIQHIQARYDRRKAIRWGITLKGEETLIGSCSFHHFGPGFHRAETGYELKRAFWGKGIMFEAMSAILTYSSQADLLHHANQVIEEVLFHNFTILPMGNGTEVNFK